MDEQLNDDVRLIQVIFPSEGDYPKSTRTSRDWDPLCPVTGELRGRLSGESAKVQEHFAASFKKLPNVPAVAKITLREDAHAKSFRPSEVFNDSTCPIIGVNAAGELYVSATDDGLKKLKSVLEGGDEVKTIAHISTISRIEPYDKQDATQQQSTKEIAKAKKVGVQLFRHRSESANKHVESAFTAIAKKHGVANVTPVKYADSITVYATETLPDAAVQEFASFVGTQSIGPIPEYKLVRTQARVIRSLSSLDLPAPQEGKEYGIIGMIDSGTDDRNKKLRAWVLVRDEYWVPSVNQDNSHGSFVAGIMINGRGLNHGDARFPSAASKIVDVVAVDKSDRVHESDLIMIIDFAIKKYPYVKVWNLSLALVGEVRKMSVMSRLGAALDERTRKHGVLFVVPTGNLELKELRQWPPQSSIGEQDRMPPPGDSLLSLTVGGLAHDDNDATCVKREFVSPFSLRGPGFGACMKPEVAHYAGNCDLRGNYQQTGILSVDKQENLAEDVGVSFAVPSVSTICANVFRELQVGQEAVDPMLVKALTVHSAFLHNPRFNTEFVEYIGAGRPQDVSEIVNCNKSSATIILKIPVKTTPPFTKRPFPMPRCLWKDGKLRAEVFMTLAYQPPMDKQFGIEYCRTNITASLGTIGIDPETNDEKYHRQVHPALTGIGNKYPEDIVELGMNWSPLKLYRRKFTRFDANGIWRLTLTRLDRAELEAEDPQDVNLIITIRDLAMQEDVHRELVQEMRALGWHMTNLGLRSRPRHRDRG